MFTRRILGGGRAVCATLSLLIFAPSIASAQTTGSVAGEVRDIQTGQPLAAAEVILVGTDNGMLTQANGRYSLSNVPVGEAVVRVRQLGYRTETRSVAIRAGETTVLNVEMGVSAISLEGLVVTAAGEQRRRELGNSAAQLSAPQLLESTIPTNLTGLLQGQAPGVTVQLASGTTGGSSTIRIRGNSSISLNNTPLIYIDGARVSNNVASGPGVGGQTTSRLNDLNPNEIESIEIVKGPSAATLYGTEASAGVIRITTRRGRSGTAEWTFRSEMGQIEDVTPWPSSAVNLRAFFGNAVRDTVYTMNLLKQDGTDLSPWRKGLEQTHGLSLRGGSDNATYFLSGDVTDLEGTLPNNFMQRYSLRSNLNLTPSDKVNVSSQVGYTSSKAQLPDNDNNGFGYIGVALLGFPWEKPLTRTDPVTGEQNVETCAIDYEIALAFGIPFGSFWECAPNPFFGGRTFDDVATIQNQQQIERFTASSTVDYRPFSVLSTRASVGYDQFSDQTGYLIPVDPALPFGRSSLGERAITNFVNRNFTLEASSTLELDLLPSLRSSTSVGAQFYRQLVEAAGSSGEVLPAGTGTVSNAVTTSGFESVVENRTLGIFVQQQFGYQDRIFVTPALRLDENSAFGRNLGRQAYPRVMASWVLSEESWLPLPAFTESLRVRGAWGTSGKQPSTFAALQLLSSQRVTFRGQDLAGIGLTRPGNPDLKPETGRELELGFEADLLEGRVGIDFTFYDQLTQDAIVSRPQAPSTGFSSAQFTNVGEMKNSGMELGLDVILLQRPDLTWDWRFTGATNKGEITSLTDPIIYGLGGNTQRHAEGFPYGAYWGFRYSIGADGEVDISDEAEYLGHPTPEWEGSFSSSLTLWNRVTLFANFGFQGGHQQFNSTEEFMCGFLGGGRYGATCLASFETDADGNFTDLARLKQAASEDVEISPWIEDADFLRLRTVSARVQLPSTWMARVGATRGHFTLAGENLAIWTGYTGMDPEINFAGGAQATRAEFLTLPPARRVTGQLSITF